MYLGEWDLSCFWDFCQTGISEVAILFLEVSLGKRSLVLSQVAWRWEIATVSTAYGAVLGNSKLASLVCIQRLAEVNDHVG